MSSLVACRNLVEGLLSKREAEVGNRRGIATGTLRRGCKGRLRAFSKIKSCGVRMDALGSAAFERSLFAMHLSSCGRWVRVRVIYPRLQEVGCESNFSNMTGTRKKLL